MCIQRLLEKIINVDIPLRNMHVSNMGFRARYTTQAEQVCTGRDGFHVWLTTDPSVLDKNKNIEMTTREPRTERKQERGNSSLSKRIIQLYIRQNCNFYTLFCSFAFPMCF